MSELAKFDEREHPFVDSSNAGTLGPLVESTNDKMTDLSETIQLRHKSLK